MDGQQQLTTGPTARVMTWIRRDGPGTWQLRISWRHLYSDDEAWQETIYQHLDADELADVMDAEWRRLAHHQG